MRATLFITLALFAPAAFGGPAAEGALGKAQEAFDALSFDEAVKQFEQALKAPGTREQRIAAWKGLALSRAYMGDGAEATEAFMKLLSLDPDAAVDTKLGPRITRPLDDARRASKKKRSPPVLSRARNGALQATFSDHSGMAHELRLRWRAHGASDFQLAAGSALKTLTVKTPPEEDLEAYLQVVDEWEGVLFEVGTAQSPKDYQAVVRTASSVPKAVAVAVEDARVKSGAAPRSSGPAIEDEPGPTWPWWLVGAAVVVGGGVAGAWYLTRPVELNLPHADRTGTLP